MGGRHGTTWAQCNKCYVFMQAFFGIQRQSKCIFPLDSTMPKEEPCLCERSPCATSSKDAKDKSNSSTLLAIRDTKDTDNSGGRGSRCSSEKDSGYSGE